MKTQGKLNELLNTGLQELHHQLEFGDVAKIARSVKMEQDTIHKYLRGGGTVTDTGKKILNAGRKLIMQRQVA